MLVVLLVARDAFALGVLVGRRRVAVLAFDPCMTPQKRKARLVVIEADRPLPVGGVMAGIALPSELVLVLVVLAMARITIGTDIVETPDRSIGMTAVTIGTCMLPNKWKTGLLVHLPHFGYNPRISSMAAGTILTNSALMNIGMASVAICWSLREIE